MITEVGKKPSVEQVVEVLNNGGCVPLDILHDVGVDEVKVQIKKHLSEMQSNVSNAKIVLGHLNQL